MTELIWSGDLRSPGRCGLCGASASPVFGIGDEWACRSCILDPNRGIAVEDERGDRLVTPEDRVRQLDSVVSMWQDGGLPDTDHVVCVLQTLIAQETQFDFAGLLKQWRRGRYLTPRQMNLVQWRLKTHDIEHEPSEFRVSTRLQKEIDAVLEMENWKRERLLSYLSAQQKDRLGL